MTGLLGTLRSHAPARLKRPLQHFKQRLELNRLDPIPCDPVRLRRTTRAELDAWLSGDARPSEWAEVVDRLAPFAIPDGTGGVNPGDRRALYQVLRALNPASVLEIGTHIGASTVHIASALQKGTQEDGRQRQLVSVDLFDVNDEGRAPWRGYGMALSPRRMIEQLGFDDATRFVTRDSVGFLETSDTTFDFIFLDGDHSAKAVYNEVPRALRRLNDGGVILLHDYFPGADPLWSDKVVIEGPFRAVERLRAEGAHIEVLPLGRLDWPTKHDSSVTSLALLTRT